MGSGSAVRLGLCLDPDFTRKCLLVGKQRTFRILGESTGHSINSPAVFTERPGGSVRRVQPYSYTRPHGTTHGGYTSHGEYLGASYIPLEIYWEDSREIRLGPVEPLPQPHGTSHGTIHGIFNFKGMARTPTESRIGKWKLMGRLSHVIHHASCNISHENYHRCSEVPLEPLRAVSWGLWEPHGRSNCVCHGCLSVP